MLQMFYIVGSNKSRAQWRVLEIDRLEPSELNIREDPTTYSTSECYDLLKRVHEGNISTGGLRFVTKCYGIAGMCSLDLFHTWIKLKLVANPSVQHIQSWCSRISCDIHVVHFQGSSSSWVRTTCCSLLGEGRLVPYWVIPYMLSPRAKWLHFQIRLCSPIWSTLKMRTGPLSILYMKNVPCTIYV